MAQGELALVLHAHLPYVRSETPGSLEEDWFFQALMECYLPLLQTIEEAACREVLEETNVRIKILGLIDVINSIDHDDNNRVKFHYTLVDFVASWKSGEIVAGDDAAAARWVSLSELEDYKLRPLTINVIRSANKFRKSSSFGLIERSNITL